MYSYICYECLFVFVYLYFSVLFIVIIISLLRFNICSWVCRASRTHTHSQLCSRSYSSPPRTTLNILQYIIVIFVFWVRERLVAGAELSMCEWVRIEWAHAESFISYSDVRWWERERKRSDNDAGGNSDNIIILQRSQQYSSARSFYVHTEINESHHDLGARIVCTAHGFMTDNIIRVQQSVCACQPAMALATQFWHNSCTPTKPYPSMHFIFRLQRKQNKTIIVRKRRHWAMIGCCHRYRAELTKWHLVPSPNPKRQKSKKAQKVKREKKSSSRRRYGFKKRYAEEILRLPKNQR